MPLQFRAETNLLVYQRQHDLMVSNIKENIVRTKADVTGSISDEQTIGMAFAMDNTFYSDGRFENHTDVDFNPYYLFQNDDWKIRLGAHVDLAFGFGKKFRAAPDVEIQYIFSDSYILYAQGKGGRLQNDFRRLETITPYGITNQQLDNTYEQLNAAIGFKASPVSGLWFNLYGGYQDLKNDLIDTPTVKSDGISNVFLTKDTKNLYAGADLSYNYKDVFYLAANAVYRHWTTDSDGSDVVVSFKPAVEGNPTISRYAPISHCLSHRLSAHFTPGRGGQQGRPRQQSLSKRQLRTLQRYLRVCAREQLAEQRLPVLLGIPFRRSQFLRRSKLPLLIEAAQAGALI